jgi:DNA helicase II / ATP-dependent DNA helicase PcrA
MPEGQDLIQSIVRDEESLLSGIAQVLAEYPILQGAKDDSILEELERIRKEIPGAKAEDKGALLEQYDRQAVVLDQLRKGRQTRTVDPASPYFAHMRLTEGERSRDLFLGKATRIDHGLRIVDWRNAPISKLFYSYCEGDEYTELFGNKERDGKIVARRTVAIQHGELSRIAAPQGNFLKGEGENWIREERPRARLVEGSREGLVTHAQIEGVARRLGGSGGSRGPDKHLPDIAALLDGEQFELITHPDSGIVAIRGGAGSGKTTVALHRAAWLTYQDARRFAPHRMQVVVWGKALRDYISHVLPGLGVAGVPVDTWQNWSKQQVKRLFHMMPKERADDTPEVVTRLKLHPGLLRILEEHVATNRNKADISGVIEDWTHVLTDPVQLFEGMQEHYPGAFTLGELRRAADWSRLQQNKVLSYLEGDREDWAALDHEDDAILLFLFQLRVGPLRKKGRPIKIAHLVIDEVQDFSPIELKILLGVCDKNQCVTLSGDTQQHIIEHSGFQDWDELFEMLDVPGKAISTLKVGYRSTERISAFARKALGEQALDEPLLVAAKEGPPVELFQFTDDGACVAFLADALKELVRHEANASIAVITPNAAVSQMYFEGLYKGEVPKLRRVLNQEFAFEAGVDVTEVTEVKGLEFDYVILVEVSARYFPDDAHARRLLHVGATRASHQLWITAVGTPSPALPGRD